MTQQRILANQAGELEATLADLTTVCQTMAGVSVGASLQESMSALMRTITQRTKASSFFLYYWDAEVQEFLPIKFGADTGAISPSRRLIRELIRRLTEDHQAGELEANDLWINIPSDELRGTARTALLLPLQVQEKVVGVLGMLDVDRQVAGTHLNYLRFVSFSLLAASRQDRRLREMNRQNAELLRMRERLEVVLDEQKRRQAMIEELERRFASVLDIVADAMITLDETQNIVLFNKGAEQIFGYPANQVLGRPFDVLVSQHLVDGWRQQLDELIVAADGGDRISARREIFGRRKDSTEFPAEVSISRLCQDGRVTFIAILHDISERKQAEAELQHAKERAEAADRAKSEFLANMSHEIRTPMNGIIGMTELALDTVLTAEQREYLSMVRTSADGLLGVLNDILDFSKIERRKLEIEAIPFSIHTVLTDLLKPLMVRAQEKGLELTGQVLPGVPGRVVGDPGRLRQIVMNLVGNAIKFTERGQIVVQIEFASKDSTGVVLHGAVSDSGIGIPKSQQQHIFEPFRQVDGSITRRFGGTGLGLAISMNLVELMGGRLWVDSEPHKGSTFHFTVRLGLPDAPPEVSTWRAADVPGLVVDDSAVNQATARPPAHPRAQRLQVLLAEDNPVNRHLAARILEKRGHNVTVAVNGKEALVALEHATFDVVLMDVQMPEVDGFEVTAAIRARETVKGSHLPVIAMTAHAMKCDQKRCLEAGMDDYLCKPLDAERLIAVVETLAATGRT